MPAGDRSQECIHGELKLVAREDCPAVERKADRTSGVRVFRDTRIPSHAIFGNLEAGATIQELTGWFEGLREARIGQVLRRQGRMPQEDRLT